MIAPTHSSHNGFSPKSKTFLFGRRSEFLATLARHGVWPLLPLFKQSF
jgi:hypothetical protein